MNSIISISGCGTCCKRFHMVCLFRKQLEGILENLKEKPDVGTLLLALQRTLEFEDELAEKFGGRSTSREIGNEIEEIGRDSNSQTVSDIRKKYEKKLAANQGEPEVCILVFLTE
ncbi:hypothetical protein MANES_07G058173v8 [Manihot esculenta]|uniref:Uncharacterized protein n=2 Tax=Manihot esculenta TaxID=3983 RepID=A0ACB7HI95_MANES|nr:hypothetical protein MANES_12G128950v8 [Manihot esculenta]KAG8650561.1 hypothetical protein MANES_07G058173v8 [Manihot esculenta]